MSRHLFVLRAAGESEEIAVARHDSGWILTRGDVSLHVEVQTLPDGRLSLLSEDGRQFCGRARPRGTGEIEVVTSRGAHLLPMADQLHDRLAHSGGDAAGGARGEEIRASRAGIVDRVTVSAGQTVEGEALMLSVRSGN